MTPHSPLASGSAGRPALSLVAAACIVVGPAIFGHGQARADVIDDLLSATHTPKWWFQNPYSNNGLNPIVGIDGNGKDEYALVWQNGDVARYHEGDMGTDHFATFGAIGNATAISYVTPGAGVTGDFAVANLSGFKTYTSTGVELDGYNVTSTGIQDLDINLGKVWVGTTSNFGWRQGDGTINEMLPTGYDGFEAIDLINGYNDRMHNASGSGSQVRKFDSNLQFLPDIISTEYTSDHGFGLTENDLIVVVSDYVMAYDNPYKGFMVPEPTSLALLAGGAFLAAAAAKKRIR